MSGLSFGVINGKNPLALCAVQKFLAGYGIPKHLIAAKISSVQASPAEDAFVLITYPNQQVLVGLAEIMVEFKFTRGLSKVCHIDGVYLTEALGDRTKEVQVAVEKFIGEHFKKEGCYKTLLAETNKNVMSIHEKAGLQKNQVYMETPFKEHLELLRGRL